MADYSTVWVEDRSWRLRGPHKPRKCRFAGCASTAVAEFSRIDRKRRKHWWAYCALHMYGRRIEDGRVLCEVYAGSIAAKQGYAD